MQCRSPWIARNQQGDLLWRMEEMNTGVLIHRPPALPSLSGTPRRSNTDPEEANQMLDALGLDKKDGEGFRLRSDGKRLVVFANYTINP
jgi:hypothetical protein